MVQPTIQFVSVVCSDGGHRPVPANALVQLRLYAQKLLQVLSCQVEVGNVTANNVRTDLRLSNIQQLSYSSL